MKVIATQPGIYGIHRHEPGTVFEIPDSPQGPDGKPLAFSSVWMQPVEGFPSPAQPLRKTEAEWERWHRLRAFFKRDVRSFF
jgi:hypothetical protein